MAITIWWNHCIVGSTWISALLVVQLFIVRVPQSEARESTINIKWGWIFQEDAKILSSIDGTTIEARESCHKLFQESFTQNLLPLFQNPSEMKYGACHVNSSAKSGKCTQTKGGKTSEERSATVTKPFENHGNCPLKPNTSLTGPPSRTGKDVKSSTSNVYHPMHPTRALNPDDMKNDNVGDANVSCDIFVVSKRGGSRTVQENEASSSKKLSDTPSKLINGESHNASSSKNYNSTENKKDDCSAERSVKITTPLENGGNCRSKQNETMSREPLSQTRNRQSCNNILQTNVVCNGSSDEDEDLYGEPNGNNARSYAGNVYHPMHPTRVLYPTFSDRARRDASFRSWSNPHRCSTTEAAEAGLFYPGSGSDLMCYHCGAAIQALTSFDDAWMEHARISPGCPFVRSTRGEQFIRMVQEMCDNDIDDSVLERELNAIELDDRPQLPEPQTNRGQHSAHSTKSVSSTSGPWLSTAPSSQSPNFSGTPSASTDDRARYALPRRTQPVPPSAQRATRALRRPRTPKRQVQAREVRARLDLDWAQELIKMGYSNDLLGAVIAEQLIYEGDDFKSFKDMLMATIDAVDQGDSYPVRHYALGLSQNTTISSSGEATKPANCAGAAPARSTGSNSAAALSAGASSWTEATPSGQSNGVTTVELETENRKLKEKKICKICYEIDANMVCLPCGHLVVCENCSRRGEIRLCPRCKKPLQGVFKTYL